MTENEKKQSFLAEAMPRILKATLQALILVIFYFILVSFMPPLEGSLSTFKSLVDTFIVVYIFFVFASTLTSGTIYQHALNVGKSLFTLYYAVYALSGGILSGTVQTVRFLIDLKIFLALIIPVCVIGLAKNLLQTIQFLADKTEPPIQHY